MKAILQVLAVLLAIGIAPALGQSQYPYPNGDRDRDSAHAQQQALSPDDQREFNKEYGKWQEANQRNDRDDVDKHARKMEDIMARYRIPPDTPFDTIATSGGYDRHYDARQYQGRFSPEDQKKFDKAYEHWMKHRNGHDRDDAARDENHMQEIMARYQIPRDVAYDQLASGGRGYDQGYQR